MCEPQNREINVSQKFSCNKVDYFYVFSGPDVTAINRLLGFQTQTVRFTKMSQNTRPHF